MASDGRSYVTGYFALDLDGFKCGLIQTAQGGDSEGDLALASVGQVKYNDFEVELSHSLAQPIKDWIEASLAGITLRKSGEIKVADFKRQVRSIHELRDTLLTEIIFPACDGAAKDPAFLSLKLSPEEVLDWEGDGSTLDVPAVMEGPALHRSDFRLLIKGLEAACAEVQKIDAIPVRLAVDKEHTGLASLKLTLPEEHAKPFLAWHDGCVIDGNNEEEKHRSGSLELLDPTGQKALLTLTFSGLGISEVSSATRTNNEDKIASVTVEMYCENISAKFG